MRMRREMNKIMTEKGRDRRRMKKEQIKVSRLNITNRRLNGKGR